MHKCSLWIPDRPGSGFQYQFEDKNVCIPETSLINIPKAVFFHQEKALSWKPCCEWPWQHQFPFGNELFSVMCCFGFLSSSVFFAVRLEGDIRRHLFSTGGKPGKRHFIENKEPVYFDVCCTVADHLPFVNEGLLKNQCLFPNPWMRVCLFLTQQSESFEGRQMH